MKFELSEEERKDLLRDFAPPYNSSGFDQLEDAEDFLDVLLNYDYKFLPEKITLWRILFIENEEDFNDLEIGKHWILNPDNLHDDHWIELIRVSGDYSDVEPIVVKALFNFNDIDQISTLQNNLLYPDEQEITLKTGNIKPIEFELYKLEEIRKKDLKELRKLNIK